jgi:ribosomal protein L11 methyltransferase
MQICINCNEGRFEVSSGSFWSEIKVEVPVEYGEVIAEVFQDEGAGGVVYDDPMIRQKVVLQDDEYFGKELDGTIPARFGLRVYYPVDDRLGERIERLKEKIGRILGCPPQFELKQVQEEDWAEAWKSYFKPEHIGKIVIKPSWEEYAPLADELVIELDPGMAFGTGTHPTTRLCLKLLPEVVTAHTTMLDLGTGSGILALAAAKLGVSKIIATDIDPLAVRVAQQNISRNGAEGLIAVYESDLLQRPLPVKFNLVVANIITNAILQVIPHLSKVLEEKGLFLASGIIEERFPEIKAGLEQHGFVLNKYLTEDGWSGVVAIRR